MASWAADVSRFGGEIAGETLSDARVASEGPRATFPATFSFGSNTRGGQAPALRKQWGFRSGLKVCKTLMSIASCIAEHPKVCKTLMCLDSLGCHFH